MREVERKGKGRRREEERKRERERALCDEKESEYVCVCCPCACCMCTCMYVREYMTIIRESETNVLLTFYWLAKRQQYVSYRVSDYNYIYVCMYMYVCAHVVCVAVQPCLECVVSPSAPV